MFSSCAPGIPRTPSSLGSSRSPGEQGCATPYLGQCRSPATRQCCSMGRWRALDGQEGKTGTQLAEERPPAKSLLSLLLIHQSTCQATRLGVGMASSCPGWTGCAKGTPCTTPGLTGGGWAQGCPRGAAGTLTAPCSPQRCLQWLCCLHLLHGCRESCLQRPLRTQGGI